MKILLLGAFMMWRTPATLELNLSSVSVDGRVPQHTTLWKGGKPLAKAFLRFIGLMLRPTLFKCPMDPTPQGIKLLQMLLVTDVGVTIWKLPFVLPCINVGSNMHHVSLYKCTTRDEAEALQKHIETSVFVPADTVGQVGPSLSRHLSICRTARLALGLDAYVEAVREAISAFYDNCPIALCTDQRKIHVSL